MSFFGESRALVSAGLGSSFPAEWSGSVAGTAALGEVDSAGVAVFAGASVLGCSAGGFCADCWLFLQPPNSEIASTDDISNKRFRFSRMLDSLLNTEHSA